MSLVKSKQRVADHGEVFTPPWLAEAMLNLVKDETERIDSRFLEPACGSGNFLVQILRRKLAAYLRTRFVRFLVSLRKNTPDIYNERFQFVPDLPTDSDWTDEKLYKKYGISKIEVTFIESMIRPMADDDE